MGDNISLEQRINTAGGALEMLRDSQLGHVMGDKIGFGIAAAALNLDI